MPQAVSLEEAFGGGGGVDMNDPRVGRKAQVDPALQAQRDAYASRIIGGQWTDNPRLPGSKMMVANDVGDEPMSPEVLRKNQQELEVEIAKTKDPEARRVLIEQRGYPLDAVFGGEAKGKGVSLDEAFAPKLQTDWEMRLGAAGAYGKVLAKEAAGLVEMFLGMPAAWAGTMGEAVIKNSLNLDPGSKITRENISNTAEEYRKYISEKGSPTWLTDAIDRVTGGQDPNEHPTAMKRVMTWADELIDNAGSFYENASGQKINKADFTSTAYGVLNAFGIRGMAKIGQKKAEAAANETPTNTPAATPPATPPTPPPAAPSLPWKSVAEETKAGTDPTLYADYAETTGNTPGSRLQNPPPPPTAGGAGVAAAATLAAKDLPAAEVPAAKAKVRQEMPDDKDWATFLVEYADREAKAASEEPKGKVPTAEELLAEINESPKVAAEAVKPLVEAPFSDKAAKALLVTGGAGAALAYAYGGDKNTDVPLTMAAAGLLLFGKFERDAIAKMSPDSSMAALREQITSTLKIVEEIPGGWSQVPIKWLNDQLKRQDVTKAEKDLFQPVLEAWKDKTSLSSRDLISDLKFGMGEFELKEKVEGEYSDYGLERIDRFDKHAYEEDMGRLGDDEQPTGADVKSKTSIWQLPNEATGDPNSNHFGDPNYFGHTRSFVEDGIKHVVEIQSDLAQKQKAPMTPQVRQETTEALNFAETQYSKVNKAVENFWDYRNPPQINGEGELRLFKRGVAALNLLIETVPPALGDRYKTMARNLIEASATERAALDKPTAFHKAIEERLKSNPGHRIDTFDVFTEIAEKGEIPWKEARDYASFLGDSFDRIRNELQVKIAEHKTKLAEAKDIAYLDPMMKNWAKRLVREELAEWARGNDGVVGVRQKEIAKLTKELNDWKRMTEDPAETFQDQKFARFKVEQIEGRLPGLKAIPPQVVRFATADTVAKVEGWGEALSERAKNLKSLDDQIAKTKETLKTANTFLDESHAYIERIKAQEEGPAPESINPVDRTPLQAALARQKTNAWNQLGAAEERVRAVSETLKGLEADRRGFTEASPQVLIDTYMDHYAKRIRREEAWSRNGVSMTLDEMAVSRAKAERKIEGARANMEKALAKGKIFENPDHAGIYDRYSTDVEKFLKQLGGTPYTDAKGHTWFEVPFKPGEAARRSQMFGGAETRVLLGIAAVGMGIVVGTQLDKDNPIWAAVKGAVIGAALVTGAVPKAIRVLRKIASPTPDKRIRITDLTEHREYNEKVAAVAIWRVQNEIIKLLPKKADRIAAHEALDAGTQATLVGKQKQAADLAERFYSALSVLSKEIDVDKLGTKDLAEVVGIYGTAVARNISNKMFLTELKATTDAAGNPLVVGIKKAPKDFVLVNNPLLQGVRVNPDIAPSLKFMFEAQEPGAVMAALSTFNTAIKKNAVALSMFHAMALLHAGLGALNPFTTLKIVGQAAIPRLFGEQAFLKQLRDTGSKGIIGESIRDGLVFSLERAAAASEDVGGGFYRGMATLQRILDDAIPGLHLGAPFRLYTAINHALDNFMWGRLHAGLKLQVYATKREALVENSARAGRPITEEQAGRIAAHYANDVFGGLNWQRLAEGSTSRWGRDLALAAASPTGRRATQLILFAPDWTLSTTRALTQALTKDLKNAPSGILSAKSIGDLHRQQLIRSALYYAVIGDALNYHFVGHHLWDPQQKDWTRIELDSRRSMQLSKHFNEPFHWVMHPAQQALNKLAYIPKEAANQALSVEYLSAKGRMRPMEPGVVGHLKHAAKGMSPIGMQQIQDGGMEAGISGALGMPIYGKSEEQIRRERLEKALKAYQERVGR